MNDLKVCQNCYLCKELINHPSLNKAYCLLVRRVVSSAVVDCPSAITGDDKTAAREEYLEKKHGIGYASLSAWAEDLAMKYDVVVKSIKLRDEMAKVKADILRVKLEREKLRLERELHWGGKFSAGDTSLKHAKAGGGLHETGGMVKPLPKMQTFLCENCGESVQICEESIGKKVHWKCMVCHQQNCFEVNKE